MLTASKNGRTIHAMMMEKPVDECLGVVQCALPGCEAYLPLVVGDDDSADEQVAWFLEHHECRAPRVHRHGTAQVSAREAVRTVVQGALLENAKKIIGCGGIDEDTATFKRIEALTEVVVKQLAPVVRPLPERKEWDPENACSTDSAFESSEYVDGWNEALDAVGALV